MYELEVVPSEQTDSEYIIWHNARTTYVDEKFASVVKVIVPATSSVLRAISDLFHGLASKQL